MLLVVKMGGSILKEGASSELISDLKALAKENKIVLVHGGGVEVTEIAAKLGKDRNSSFRLKASEAATPTRQQSKFSLWSWQEKSTNK